MCLPTDIAMSPLLLIVQPHAFGHSNRSISFGPALTAADVSLRCIQAGSFPVRQFAIGPTFTDMCMLLVLPGIDTPCGILRK